MTAIDKKKKTDKHDKYIRYIIQIQTQRYFSIVSVRQETKLQSSLTPSPKIPLHSYSQIEKLPKNPLDPRFRSRSAHT